ncbi:MAG: hypothetical protein ACOYEV_11835 [Candidatus Nanopelagicales bacterium]
MSNKRKRNPAKFDPNQHGGSVASTRKPGLARRTRLTARVPEHLRLPAESAAGDRKDLPAHDAAQRIVTSATADWIGSAQADFGLSEDAHGGAVAAPWIASLVALGARVSRFAQRVPDRQLVVAISVPRRDFAAALVGCGWVLASPAPQLAKPVDILRGLMPHTPLRVVTDQSVITDFVLSFSEAFHPPRVVFKKHGWGWETDRFRAVTVLPALDKPVRVSRPVLGSIGILAGLEETWDARLASANAGLAIVGTLTRLNEDMTAFVTCGGTGPGSPTRLSELLLPFDTKAATWFTRTYPSVRLSDRLPLPSDVKAVVLDGAGAIKHLTEISAPIAICILDRSVADDTAGEIIVQLRNARSEPVSIRDDLGWSPPGGVEALAFSLPL